MTPTFTFAQILCHAIYISDGGASDCGQLCQTLYNQTRNKQVLQICNTLCNQVGFKKIASAIKRLVVYILM